MIPLSTEYRSLTSKIYVFSFICIAVKILNIKAFSQSGVKIEFENSGVVAGALAIVLLFVCISAMLRLLRECVETWVTDEISNDEIEQISPSELSANQDRDRLFSERWFWLIRMSAFFSFVTDGVLPILFGLSVFWYSTPNVLELFAEIAT